MNIYVKSRGVSKGYSWSDQNQQEIANPPMLKEGIKIVDSDNFSLVLYRLEGRLFLLITVLETKNRTDNRTRRIRNSVLWVGDSSDEATLRSLSIQALNGELATKVDRAIVSENNDQGFKVDFEQLKTENIGLQSVENSPADFNKIGNLSACKDDLIGDLKKYSLPKHAGMLVVVSSTVSQSNLEQNQVWRGLSDAISDDEWIDLPVKEGKGDNFRHQPSDSNRVPDIPPKSEKSKSGSDSTHSPGVPKSVPESSGSDQRSQKDSTLKKWGSIIIAFVIGVLVGIVGHYLYYSKIPNWQKDKIQKNDQTILEQRQKIAGQKQKIAEQEDTIAQKEKTIEKEDKLIREILDYTKDFTKKGAPLIERADELIDGIQK